MDCALRGGGPASELHQCGCRTERHANRDQPPDPAAREELGVRLFVRQNRALALTPEAREYLPASAPPFNDLSLPPTGCCVGTTTTF